MRQPPPGLTLLTLVLWATGCADNAPPAPDLAVRDAWVREAGAPVVGEAPVNSAAYMTIENRGDAADRLLAVDADIARRVELHRTVVDDRGMAIMRPEEAVDVPAGETAQLRPGGLHVMLLGIDSALTSGDTIEMVLRFEKSGRLELRAPVARAGDGSR